MIKFSTRSSEKELLDGRDIPQEAVVQNMKELNVINTYLGGTQVYGDRIQKTKNRINKTKG